MRSRNQKKSRKYEYSRTKWKNWQIVVTILAAIVVFFTTYVLILPALTWEKQLVCEKEEHVHTDACYAYLDEITETAEEGHVVSNVISTPTLSLVCGLEENENHVHQESCYAVEMPDKSERERVLICGKAEHVHIASCFDAPPAELNPYFCNMTEHTHTAECYFNDGSLKCTLQEHVHDDTCLTEETAIAESEESEQSEQIVSRTIESAPAADGAKAVITGNLPDGAEALIEAVELSEEEMIAYFGAEKAAAMNSFVAYDIKIMVNGEEWQPDESVIVQVKEPAIEVAAGEDIGVAHIDGEDDTVSEVNAELAEDGEVVFDADGFSVYVIYTFTVDFHYGDVNFSIAGRSNISLAELFAVLNIPRSADDIVNVTFSDPSLIAVNNTADGWNLVSLEPFSTDEILTIEFSDGEIYQISVTDAQTTYWKKVTSVDELTTSGVYMITASNGTLFGAADDGTVQVSSTGVTVSQTYPGYFECTKGARYQWKLTEDGATTILQNNKNNTYYVQLGRNITNPISTTSKNRLTFEKQSGGTWIISREGYNATYYLEYSNGTFNCVTSLSDTAKMNLYIQVSDPSQGGGSEEPAEPEDPGTGVTKPTYPEYVDTSSAQHGTTFFGAVAGEYWSDKASSQIENDHYFAGRSEDDGKVVTDKSVIYGNDDYNAFESYDDNVFGITLSALGQKYAISDELSVDVPLDVVFVLDTSGSMINTKFGGKTSANIMIESLNQIMGQILENEDNRVGVVCYSGASDELLPLGHYTALNNKFFDEGKCTSDTYELKPSDSIKRTDGTLKKGTFSRGWYGTYTQAGIAQGANTFLNANNITFEKKVSKETAEGTLEATFTLQRRPVFILISDGEPTYCTEDFKDVLASTNVHGNGNTGYTTNGKRVGLDEGANGTNNNKGVLGYYTILSAEYYKEQVTEKYHTDAYFYTIGIGFSTSGTDSYEESVSGDDYKRAVLNPTKTNINAIQKCTNGVCKDADISKDYSDISSFTENTCHQLYKLLHNTFGDTSIKIGKSSQQYGLKQETSSSVPVKTNPYAKDGYSYSYADGAYFTTDSSVDKLTGALKNALSGVADIAAYGFILRNNTPVVISDTIGTGMELKSAPVLRYGGINHTPSSSETDGNVTTYHYSGTYKATDGSGQNVDLSKIYAEVTDDNGVQTVKLYVPDSHLPAYSPNLNNDGTAKFYYEALPVRLIYQVGLTEQASRAVAALAENGGELSFYTNAWSDTDYSSSNWQPTSNNPYYSKNQYNKDTVSKEENTSATKQEVTSFDQNSNAQYVETNLGNNGKLTFKADGTHVNDKAPDHTKVIDAFRDGKDNPDTDLDNKADDLTDLYRLYLNVGPESALDAIDLLLVIDRSTSMIDYKQYYDAVDILGGTDAIDRHDDDNCPGLPRQYAMNSLLNGLETKGTNNTSTLYSNSLISRFLALNPENKIAVTAFADINYDVYGWTSKGKLATGNTVHGTNYVAGLKGAEALLNSVKDDGKKKVMIFLSDGEPTYHFEGLSKANSTGNVKGSGTNTNSATDQWTISSIDEFKDEFKDEIASGELTIYTIGIGNFEEKYLNRISSSGTTLATSNFQTILNEIDEKITKGVGHYSQLVIKDKLSQYVDFYDDDLDTVVQMVPKDSKTGVGTILYKDGKLTTEGAKRIKPITNDSKSGVYVDLKNKTITVSFLDTYEEEGGYVYSVSFNVEATQQAYDEYAANMAGSTDAVPVDGYGNKLDENGNPIRTDDVVENIGDINTDYTYNNNQTSSDKPGFFSNDEATLTYKQTHSGEEGIIKTVPYDDPVIQVSEKNIKVIKEWADGAEKHKNDTITVNLYMSYAGKEEKIKTAELNKDNSWTYTFEHLSGKDRTYRIAEISVDGYITTIEDPVIQDDGTVVIKIVNTPKYRDIDLQKTTGTGDPLEAAKVTFEIYKDSQMKEKIGTFETDADGKIKITGLEIGKSYWIKETIAPDGYYPMEIVKKFKVTENGVETAPGDAYVSTGENGELLVKNYTGYELPHTGGTGVMLFYTLGILLLAGALVGAFILRRARERRLL